MSIPATIVQIMERKTKRALKKYEKNPNLHLKELYTLKVKIQKRYFGEDKDFILSRIQDKIEEVKEKLEALYKEENSQSGNIF